MEYGNVIDTKVETLAGPDKAGIVIRFQMMDTDWILCTPTTANTVPEYFLHALNNVYPMDDFERDLITQFHPYYGVELLVGVAYRKYKDNGKGNQEEITNAGK